MSTSCNPRLIGAKGGNSTVHTCYLVDQLGKDRSVQAYIQQGLECRAFVCAYLYCNASHGAFLISGPLSCVCAILGIQITYHEKFRIGEGLWFLCVSQILTWIALKAGPICCAEVLQTGLERRDGAATGRRGFGDRFEGRKRDGTNGYAQHDDSEDEVIHHVLLCPLYSSRYSITCASRIPSQACISRTLCQDAAVPFSRSLAHVLCGECCLSSFTQLLGLWLHGTGKSGFHPVHSTHREGHQRG